MIIAIRIAGDVDLTGKIKETLFRMRIRRKYSAILLHENVFNEKLLNKVKDFVAYGKITKPLLEKLIELRGQPVKGKKIDAGKVALELEKKSLTDLGLKPFFRLHPPRGGIDSKLHFNPKTGKGVLGNNKEKINDLLERML